MPSTSGHSLPYPASTDTPDVPYYMQQLAQGVETAMTQDFTQRCVVQKNATQSIANTTDVDVTWETEIYDPNGWHAANSSTITVPVDGIYAINAIVHWDSPAAQSPRATRIILNGNQLIAHGDAPYSASVNNAASNSSCHWTGYLAAGSTVKVSVWQNSGGALNIENQSSSTRTTEFSVVKLPMIF